VIVQPPWHGYSASVARALDGTVHLRRCPGSMSSIMQNPLRQGNFHGMKSHDWITMLGPVGVYYYECMGVDQKYKTAFQSFMWWLYELRAPRLSRERIESNLYAWERWGIESMTLIEPLMPDDFMTINFHLITHLCQILRKYGPMMGHWMMKDERYHHIMKAMLTAHKSVEETLARGVIEFEHISWDELDREIETIISTEYHDVFGEPVVTPIGIGRPASDAAIVHSAPIQFQPWRKERRTPSEIIIAKKKIQRENEKRRNRAKTGQNQWTLIHIFFMHQENMLVGKLHKVFKSVFRKNNEWRVWHV
jgi:hypothetical protein